jgi:hypothetical protein
MFADDVIRRSARYFFDHFPGTVEQVDGFLARIVEDERMAAMVLGAGYPRRGFWFSRTLYCRSSTKPQNIPTPQF